jgi:hypothetical protein
MNMDPLAIFLIVGQVQLAAMKSSLTVNQASPVYWPSWALKEPGRSIMPLFFTVSGLCFFGTMVFGFFHLEWWIPLVCLVIVFPFVHLAIRFVIPDAAIMILGTAISLVGAILVAIEWAS